MGKAAEQQQVVSPDAMISGLLTLAKECKARGMKSDAAAFHTAAMKLLIRKEADRVAAWDDINQ